jgi:hypothetical protein
LETVSGSTVELGEIKYRDIRDFENIDLVYSVIVTKIFQQEIKTEFPAKSEEQYPESTHKNVIADTLKGMSLEELKHKYRGTINSKKFDV